jgi:PPM family protein phosphatase
MSTSAAPTTPSTTFSSPETSAPAPHLSVHSFGLTDRGRVRPANEDHFLIADMAKAMHVWQSSRPQPETQFGEERGFLFVVADGMGGHQAGERASSLAVETIEDFMLNTFKWFFHLQGPEEHNALTEFQTALRKADERVYDKAMHRPELYGMGTTLTMAYALNTDLYVVHVGDSRCYLTRDRRLYRLTHDHTLTGELVRRGHLDPKEAVHHHLRHVVTNAVGGNKLGVEVEAQKVTLEPGDVLVLCSDGLTEMVPEQCILSILLEQANPQLACARLVGEANESGGKDNITVIVARFGDPNA